MMMLLYTSATTNTNVIINRCQYSSCCRRVANLRGGERGGKHRFLWIQQQQQQQQQQPSFRQYFSSSTLLLTSSSSRQVTRKSVMMGVRRSQQQKPLKYHHHHHRTTTNNIPHSRRYKTTSTSSSSSNTSKEAATKTSTTASTATTEKVVDVVVKEPGLKSLQLVALAQAIPFLGFGFMDNAILIVAGDAIDTSLGVMLGISTLCAAAIGNIISDLAGISLGTIIEDFCTNHLKLPQAKLSSAQRQLRSVRLSGQLGMAIGMTIGCILGMFPLLFIDTDKIPRLKQNAKIEALFRDVVTEAKTLVGAESTVLYLRVDSEKSNDAQHTIDHNSAMPYKPNVKGDSMYARFYDVPAVKKSSSSADYESHEQHLVKEVEKSRILPLGKGIVGRAMLTGLSFNIDDVHKEPDFQPISIDDATHMKELLVVPVLDGQGNSIGAIRALNKIHSHEQQDGSGSEGSSDDDVSSSFNKGGGTGFTDQDVLILKSLATHISVSLQSLYQDLNDEDARLRDTIRILHEHKDEFSTNSSKRRKTMTMYKRRGSLFPDDEMK